ncbi:hypothetical protein J7438_24605, partial [Thalassotalea sp. G20_0]|uniref:hypothetical protein n=1 Tax=Thalassotalea sp. G20_0 TaxID=2821093 RepID=UPI001ADBBA50
TTMNVSGLPGATMTMPTPAPTVANSTMNVSGLPGATMTMPTPAPTVANTTMNVSGLPGATMTMPTPAPTVANTTMNFSDLPGATMTLPTPAPTVANSTMNVSDLTGATMTLPTTVASSAATLSTGAVGGIALGTAAFVVAGVVLGRYIYRRYCCGSYVVDHPQELVAINTVGQAQKARTQPTIKEAREKPADVQRPRSHPPEPPGLQQPALPEKPPIRPRDSFFEELREGIPWHEHNEDAGIYEEIETRDLRRMRTAVK